MRFLIVIQVFILTGCGLVSGEKVSFGNTFPVNSLRGKTYYITNTEDYELIISLKSQVIHTFESRGWVEDGPVGSATKLRVALEGYSSGWRGWF